MSMLRNGYYAKPTESIQLPNPALVIYMGAQVNSSAIANICWLIQTFIYQCFGLQVHFKRPQIITSKLGATAAGFWWDILRKKTD